MKNLNFRAQRAALGLVLRAAFKETLQAKRSREIAA
jgi:hypothetical protein